MIKVEGVNKNLEGFKIKDISFELKDGFIMGLIGPNGAGKTTLIKMLMGLVYPDKGTIRIFDKEYENNEEYIKNNIGFVYDELNFYNHLSIKDFEKIVSSFYKKFDKKLFNQYLDKFALKKKSKIGNLSKGEGMRLMLANALSHDAKLLILDEPTAGLDPIVRKEMLVMLQEAIEDGNRSVIFSTHITSDLDGIADYITFINGGELIFSEDMESIKEKYKIFRGTKEELDDGNIEFKGIKKTPYYYEGLFVTDDTNKCEEAENCTLEDIMYHYVKGDKNV